MLWSADVLAWGGTGHRISGYVAETLLTDKARDAVHALLGKMSLATAATVMDSERRQLKARWPAADRWHYDNQPVCGQAAYCADGQCATRQIEVFRQRLLDRRASQQERTLALQLLVHMLGDIHQPLHMADNADRGGNDLWVRWDTEPRPLHEVMDTLLLKQLMAGQRPAQYAQQLQRRYQTKLAQWQQGTPAQWAQQTHALAVTHSYAMLPSFACGQAMRGTLTLPDGYLDDARQYLPEQLFKAGARIAAVLNQTFK